IAGLRDQIQLQQADVKNLEAFEPESCDCVISNSLIHHIADPQTVLSQAIRLVRPGGRLFIRDLMRPETAAEADRLTEQYAGDQSPAARQLLHQSLHAALTLEEIRDLLAACGLPPESAT